MKNYQAHTPQNLKLTKILQNFRKTSTPLKFQNTKYNAIPKARKTRATHVMIRRNETSFIVDSEKKFVAPFLPTCSTSVNILHFHILFHLDPNCVSILPRKKRATAATFLQTNEVFANNCAKQA